MTDNTANSTQPATGSLMISFIVTYFNLPEEMIRECIGSIVSLPLDSSEREIILVDDGSERSPLPCLSEWIDSIVYIRQKNQGLSAARNTGIGMSKGRYIQFVDGDDALINQAYTHCIDTLRQDSEADMVLFEASDKVPPQHDIKTTGHDSGTVYMHNNNLRASACGYIFRRSLLGNLRFTPGLLHEDEEFTPQLMLRAERIISTNAKAYLYRKREESIVNSRDGQHIVRRLDDKERVIAHLRELADKMPHDERIALQRRVHQLAMDYIYNIIVLTHSKEQLDSRIERLRKMALFPLPARNYTAKYSAFRMLTKYGATRNLLLHLLRKP